MADMNALFHNPEAFTDSDLGRVRNRIRFNTLTLFGYAGALGYASYALDTMVLKRSPCYVRLSLFSVAGFMLGWTLHSDQLTNVSKLRYSQSA